MTKRKSDKPLEGEFISKDDPVYDYIVKGLDLAKEGSEVSLHFADQTVSGTIPDGSDEVFYVKETDYVDHPEDATEYETIKTIKPMIPEILDAVSLKGEEIKASQENVDRFHELIEEQGRRLARAFDEDMIRKYMGETTDGPDFEKHGVFTVSDFYSIESDTSIGFEGDTEGDREPEEGCDDTENKDGDSQIQKGKKDV